MPEAIAGALGMTVDEFEAAAAEGKTVLVLLKSEVWTSPRYSQGGGMNRGQTGSGWI